MNSDVMFELELLVKMDTEPLVMGPFFVDSDGQLASDYFAVISFVFVLSRKVH